ncbi:MAG: bifunctional glutamate N-acetyltransferase/amino-acid acetyltransferase ArgJ [Myxococcales bacterium]|nr:MAG: bifunctional glutamate N-acetyltransferase/amino-acid acetyltransferase ArgJ [Myxococcales bacterium]
MSGPTDGARNPQGFLFASVASGVRVKHTDLALIFSEVDAAAAGCFTRSRTRAASVTWSEARVPGANVRALVVNSGNANALTGDEGEAANARMAGAVATALGLDASTVLTCSTGVIGAPLPIAKIEAAVPELVHQLGPDVTPVAEAILTTDTATKVARREVFLGGDRVVVLGVAKGSGMVHPNMATVLGFILTDAAIDPASLDALLRRAVGGSFDQLSIDGDTSTNDAVIALANGVAENTPVSSPDSVEGKALGGAIAEVCRELARAVAADGEGARRLITTEVRGATDEVAARRLARAVVSSNLVKTAIFGADPNWGRVMAALGAEAARANLPLEVSDITLKLQGVEVFRGGHPVPFQGDALRALLRRSEVLIEAWVGAGAGEATAWGCDLSYDYIRINADYAAVVVASADGSLRRDTRLESKTPDLKADVLVQALRYIERFAGTRAVIKYGGAAMVRPELKDYFAHDMRLLHAVGLQPIIVHGGGPEISRTLEKMGEKTTFIDGLRVTEQSHVRVVEMVLSGQISGEIIAALSRAGARAVGLSGKDGNLISARKLLSPSGADLGYVGEVTRVDPTLLELLLAQGYLPVVSPLGLGDDGQTYNINADAVAAEAAVACKAQKLIYLTDVPGILATDGSLLSELSAEELEHRMQDGTIRGGMLPKAQSILRALAGGVESVHIIDGRLPHNVVAELFTSSGVGTMIRAGAPRKEDERLFRGRQKTLSALARSVRIRDRDAVLARPAAQARAG